MMISAIIYPIVAGKRRKLSRSAFFAAILRNEFSGVINVAQYLLPCQCGRKTPVDSTKAGQTMRCECGAELEIPTLGAMKKLQRVEQKTKPAPMVRWGARQRVLLVGIIICAIGLCIAGLFTIRRPVPPPHAQLIEVIPQRVESLSLMQTIQLWGMLERGLPEGSSLEDQAYQKEYKAYLRRTTVALVIAGLGVLLMVISLFIPKKLARSQTAHIRP